MDLITYAVGDIHGCLDRMLEATAWAAEDASARDAQGLLIFLGDYVDRGTNAPGVIETLIRGPEDDHMRWLALRGNHDDMLARVWRDSSSPYAGQWWEHGGQHTLMNYGWDPLLDPPPGHLGEWVPREHAEFLGALPLIHEDDLRIFVHAGLRPGIPLADQAERDLMWIRSEFLNSKDDFGRTIVHGHTPNKKNPSISPGRINLDTGCYATGRLAVAAFDPGEPIPRIAIMDGRDKDLTPQAPGFG